MTTTDARPPLQIFTAIGAKSRLVDRVVHHIQELIVGGQLIPGVKLPAERDLAATLGVSRTVVREAVHILGTRGLLRSRAGIGTVVREVTREQVVQPLGLFLRAQGGVSIEDLHRVRSMLEVENAGLAALQATDEDIRELRQIAAEMKLLMSDPRGFAEKDSDFHRKIARTTHNPLLVVLLDSIRDLMTEVRVAVGRRKDVAVKVMPGHLRILERIEAHDVNGARKAMRQHLELARRIQRDLLLSEPAAG